MLLSGHSHRGRTESLPPDSSPQLGGAAELSEVALLGETIEHVSFITVFFQGAVLSRMLGVAGMPGRYVFVCVA